MLNECSARPPVAETGSAAAGAVRCGRDRAASQPDHPISLSRRTNQGVRICTSLNVRELMNESRPCCAEARHAVVPTREGEQHLARLARVLAGTVRLDTHVREDARAVYKSVRPVDAVQVVNAAERLLASGANGVSHDVVRMVEAHPEADLIDVGGVGGTLAGNALSVATLELVLTDDAFAHMVDVATTFTRGVQDAIGGTGVPWSVSQLGARSEYRFAFPAPRDGSTSAASGDETLEEYLHLYLVNRGVLITPFHNMALMCPVTSHDDAHLHSRLFGDALDELAGTGSRSWNSSPSRA